MIVTLLKALVIALATVPLSLLIMVVSFFQKSGRFFHTIARLWSRLILGIYGIKVSIRGTESLDPSRSYIYVSNHASMFDIPAVIVGIPDQIRIVMKRELTRIPFFGWAMMAGPYILIDRSNPKDALRSLEKAAERIRNGASVLLFAEGTRTRDGKLQPFKRGAFALAAKSSVPVVPVTINNTFRILPKGSMRVHPTSIEVVLEKPIVSNDMEGKEAEKYLMEEVHQAIERNYVEQGEE